MSELQAPLTPEQVDAAHDHIMAAAPEPEPDLTNEQLFELDESLSDGDMIPAWKVGAIKRAIHEVQRRRKEDQEIAAYTAFVMGNCERLGIEFHPDESLPSTMITIIQRYGHDWMVFQDVQAQLIAGEEREKYHTAMGWSEKARMLIAHLERKADNHLRRYKHLLEDMQVWARAIAIVAQTVADAGTHKEKDARLRGLIGACESAVAELRKDRDDQYNYYTVPDVFRSDYPVREYVRTIHRLENEIKRLTGNEDTDKRADDSPF